MGLFARKISSYFQRSHASLSIPTLSRSHFCPAAPCVRASPCPRVFFLPRSSAPLLPQAFQASVVDFTIGKGKLSSLVSVSIVDSSNVFSISSRTVGVTLHSLFIQSTSKRVA